MKTFPLFLSLIVLMALLCVVAISQDDQQPITFEEYRILVQRVDRLEGFVFTVYDTNGIAVNQGQDRKGYHVIVGSTTLSAGTAIVNMNALPGTGLQSISFLSSGTYHGTAWSIDTSNSNRYSVYPLDGEQFMIKCLTDTLDASTVKFQVEGE